MKISQKPFHYRFQETRFGQFTVQAGVLSTNIVLTPIVGRVSYLHFTVRPATGLTQDLADVFLPVVSFSILDSTSTNITGGQVVNSAMALQILHKDWIQSSYSSETATGVVNNNAYVYMYSFSADPIQTALNAVPLNSHYFRGNEQLQLVFPSTTASNYQVDVYASCKAVFELGQTSVRKLAV